MSDIQKEIKDALHDLNNEVGIEFESTKNNIYRYAPEWLFHQQQLIKSQTMLIHQLRGSLGYHVPGDIIENPNIINGIAIALETVVTHLSEAIERVIAELEHEKSLYRPSDFEEEKDDGAILAYEHSIRILKEVLASETISLRSDKDPT